MALLVTKQVMAKLKRLDDRWKRAAKRYASNLGKYRADRSPASMKRWRRAHSLFLKSKKAYFAEMSRYIETIGPE